MRTNNILETAIHHWHYVAPAIKPPCNDEELSQLAWRLDVLLDKVGQDEHHPLMGLVDILSQLISDYEVQAQRLRMGTGIDAFKVFNAGTWIITS